MHSRNNSGYNHILNHIEANRESIFLGFKEIPDISQLSLKISKFAERFEYWNKNELIGLVACYYNDKETLTGYITIASVASGFRNRGLGGELMIETLQYGSEMGFKRVRLEVYVQNHNALAFYRKSGFVIETQKENSLIMVNTFEKQQQ